MAFDPKTKKNLSAGSRICGDAGDTSPVATHPQRQTRIFRRFWSSASHKDRRSARGFAAVQIAKRPRLAACQIGEAPAALPLSRQDQRPAFAAVQTSAALRLRRCPVR